MARSYAQIFCAIWDESSAFRALPARPQRTFFLLLTQSEISACGVLPLRERRWARMAADTTIEDVQADLAVLHGARYIVVDPDSEEVLVRSFVRHDGGHRNGKRRPLILRTAREVASAAIQWAIAEEFERLDLPLAGLPSAPPDGASDALSDRASDGLSAPVADPAEPSTAPNREEPGGSDPSDTAPAFSQVDSPSDVPSDTASDGTSASSGVVVTKALVVDTHNPTSQDQEPANPPSSGSRAAGGEVLDAEIVDSAADDDKNGSGEVILAKAVNAGTIVRALVDECTRLGVKIPDKIIKRHGAEIKTLLAEGHPGERIWAALVLMSKENVLTRPSLLAQKVLEVQTGPARPPRRMTPGEQATHDLTASGTDTDVLEALGRLYGPTGGEAAA